MNSSSTSSRSVLHETTTSDNLTRLYSDMKTPEHPSQMTDPSPFLSTVKPVTSNFMETQPASNCPGSTTKPIFSRFYSTPNLKTDLKRNSDKEHKSIGLASYTNSIEEMGKKLKELAKPEVKENFDHVSSASVFSSNAVPRISSSHTVPNLKTPERPVFLSEFSSSVKDIKLQTPSFRDAQTDSNYFTSSNKTILESSTKPSLFDSTTKSRLLGSSSKQTFSRYRTTPDIKSESKAKANRLLFANTNLKPQRVPVIPTINEGSEKKDDEAYYSRKSEEEEKMQEDSPIETSSQPKEIPSHTEPKGAPQQANISLSSNHPSTFHNKQSSSIHMTNPTPQTINSPTPQLQTQQPEQYLPYFDSLKPLAQTPQIQYSSQLPQFQHHKPLFDGQENQPRQNAATYNIHRDQVPSAVNLVTPLKTDGQGGHKIITVNQRPYTVMRRIGHGGSAKVYQVLEPDNCLIRALKVVNLSDSSDVIVEGYKNEIALLQKLQKCDKVIKLYDFEYNEMNKKLLIVLEYGETDLANFINQHGKSKEQLTEFSVGYLWESMVKAVQAIHREGVIHSDLKPANFMMVSGKVKLIDFGIANALQQDKTSVFKENMVGTPSYMSPEALMANTAMPDQSKPKFKVGVKSDVWSLGCILYKLVYGETPFQNLRHKMNAIVNPNHEISFPQLDDPNLMDVMKRCLTRDVTIRPNTEELLTHPYLKHGAKTMTEKKVPALEIIKDSFKNLYNTASPRTQQALIKELQSNSKQSS